MCKFQERPPQNNIQHSFIIRFLIEARILFTFIQFYKYFRVAKWMRSVTDKMFLFSLKDNRHCVHKSMACIQEQCCFDFSISFFQDLHYQFMCTPKLFNTIPACLIVCWNIYNACVKVSKKIQYLYSVQLKFRYVNCLKER